jgi:hypothetical protein
LVGRIRFSFFHQREKRRYTAEPRATAEQGSMPQREKCYQTEAMLALVDDDAARLLSALELDHADVELSVRRGSLGASFTLLPELYARDGDRLVHMAARNGQVRCSLALLLRCVTLVPNRDQKLPQQLAQRSNRVIYTALAALPVEQKKAFAAVTAELAHEAVMAWVALLATLSARQAKTFIRALEQFGAAERKALFDLMEGSWLDNNDLMAGLDGLRPEEQLGFIEKVNELDTAANGVLVPCCARFSLEEKRELLALLAQWDTESAGAFLRFLPASHEHKMLYVGAVQRMGEDGLPFVHSAGALPDGVKLLLVEAVEQVAGAADKHLLVSFVVELMPEWQRAFVGSLEGLADAERLRFVAVLRDLEDDAQLALCAAVSSLALEQRVPLLDGVGKFSTDDKRTFMCAVAGATQLELGQVMVALSAADATQVRLVGACRGMTAPQMRLFIALLAGMVGEEMLQVINGVHHLGRRLRGPFAAAVSGLDDDLKLLCVELARAMAGAAEHKQFVAAMSDLMAEEKVAFVEGLSRLAGGNRAAFVAAVSGLPVELKQAYFEATAHLPDEIAVLTARAMEGLAPTRQEWLLRTAAAMESDEQRRVLIMALSSCSCAEKEELLAGRQRRLQKKQAVDDALLPILVPPPPRRGPLSSRELGPKRFM